MTSQTVLRIDDLRVRFAGRDDFAVRGVNLDVSKGEVVALVGESGSGKSVTSFAAMGLLPRTATATGSIRVGGEHEVIGQPDAALDGLRGRVVSMIFQEPMTALNPTMTLGGQIAEAVRNHTDSSKHVALERAVELMTLVGIPDPRSARASSRTSCRAASASASSSQSRSRASPTSSSRTSRRPHST